MGERLKTYEVEPQGTCEKEPQPGSYPAEITICSPITFPLIGSKLTNLPKSPIYRKLLVYNIIRPVANQAYPLSHAVTSIKPSRLVGTSVIEPPMRSHDRGASKFFVQKSVQKSHLMRSTLQKPNAMGGKAGVSWCSGDQAVALRLTSSAAMPLASRGSTIRALAIRSNHHRSVARPTMLTYPKYHRKGCDPSMILGVLVEFVQQSPRRRTCD